MKFIFEKHSLFGVWDWPNEKNCKAGTIQFLSDVFDVKLGGYFLFAPLPSVIYAPSYMLLYSTLLCKKIARAHGGVKDTSPLSCKRGGGGGEGCLAKQNRSNLG